MTLELTPDAVAFTTDRHLAILSTHSTDGSIHSVPVGFTVENGVVRIITSDGTQKVLNVERGGHATVGQVDGGRWISFIGTATINRDPDAVAHAVELYAGRYRQPRINPQRVVIEIAVTSVLGSSGMVER
ncbi:TIGR03618 family F420-dependent PPOX class oxidoreductase [Marisediminicola sp. LYQ134]|uniref:TIGR03618 family F420-dependent PPOX class oxidoreductase n=1 Tax=unclassified Marisediminicola TaxID=2618316 RepID=UPI003982F06E